MEIPRNQHVTPGENNAFDNLRPLESIMPLLDTLLDVEMPFDRVAEVALICLDKIGNARRCRYAVEVAVEDGFAELPANCEQVDAVLVATALSTYQQENASLLGLSDIRGVVYNAGDAPWLQAPLGTNTGVVTRVPDQASGAPRRLPLSTAIDLSELGERYLNYTYRDGGLYVGRQASASELVRQATNMDCASGAILPEEYLPQFLRVFYRGQVSDERGYPLITPEEALACAYFILSVRTQKRFFAKEATGDQVQLARQLSDQHVSQARVAPLASANGLDRLLDEGKRLHRHFFNDDLYAH